jgi:hypothetical protein
VTPIGGVLLIVGWLSVVAIAILLPTGGVLSESGLYPAC